MSRRSFALPTAVLLAAVAVGCGGGDESASAGDVPPGAVATIGDVEISVDQLDQQIDALARARRPARGSSDSGKGHGSGGHDAAAAKAQREQLEDPALSTLLMREALEQEAADRDVEVSDAKVRQRWEAISEDQFKTRKALRRFLGGQTEDDLLAQLRLQVLTERIHQQVSADAGGGKAGSKAVEQFQRDFKKRWQDRTACADGYTAVGCNDDKTE